MTNLYKTVYVYADAGVEPDAFSHLQGSFSSFSPQLSLKQIMVEEVKKGEWVKDAEAFIIPGGADLPYGRKLNGAGNAVIKEYVKNGGKFLGICAGGYYGSSYIRFDQGTEKEIAGARELAFFKGMCQGPLLGAYTPRSYEGAVIAQLQEAHTEAEQLAYYHGGGYFVDAHVTPHTKVLYTYTDGEGQGKAAVISCQYGEGKAVLSGVHPEYYIPLLEKASSSKERGYENLATIIPALKKSSSLAVFSAILKELSF